MATVDLAIDNAGNNTTTTNTADGEGTSPGGVVVDDDATADVGLTEGPDVAVTKSAGLPVNNGDGTYDIPYTLTITNVGDVRLLDVQLLDGLIDVWGTALASVTTPVITGTEAPMTCAASTAPYDGIIEAELFDAATSLLNVGESCTAMFTATIDVSGGDPEGVVDNPVTNLGETTGTSPAGTDVDDDDTAEATVTENPAIEVDKFAGASVNNGDGTHTIIYTVITRNSGDTQLDDVQTTDGLRAAWLPASVQGTAAVTNGACTANAGYDGTSELNLLGLGGAGITLAVGESCTVEITVVVDLNGLDAATAATLIDVDTDNTADTTGTSPGGSTVTDDAVATTDITENPNVDVSKTAAAPINNQDGTYDITYTVGISNTGDVVLNDVQLTDGLTAAWPSALSSVTVDSITGPCSASTDPYDGITNLDLFDATTSSLAVGEACSAVLTATVDISAATGNPALLGNPQTNTAVGEGTSPGGSTPTDDAAIDRTVEESPGIELAKTASSPINNGDGTYDVSYTIVVSNTGDQDLNPVQVSDGLSAAWTPAIAEVKDVAITGTGTCAASGTYDGVGDSDLLDAANSTLEVGEACTIVLTAVLDVRPAGAEAVLGAPQTNEAQTEALSPAGTPVESTDDADAQIDEAPGVEVTKSVGIPVNNEDGTYGIEYSMTVRNTGDVLLDQVQLLDGLSATPIPTAWGAAFSGVSAPVITGSDDPPTCAASTAPYDGDANPELFDAANSTLPVAASCTVTFTATIDVRPGSGGGDPTALDQEVVNTAQVDALSPGKMPVQDTAEIDTTITEDPSIELTKTATQPVSNADGTYTISYTLTVVNTGDVQANNVQIADGLTTAWAPASVTGTATSLGTPCVVNSAYDGVTILNLLGSVGAGVTLAVGEICRVLIEATVDVTGADEGTVIGVPKTNTATATGTSPSGTPLESESIAEATVNEDPSIELTKTSSASVNNGDGTYTINYRLVARNTGDVNLDAVQITDGLADTWGPTLASVDTPLLGGAPTCVASTAPYDGLVNVDLLNEAASTLAVGEFCSVELVVTLDVRPTDAEAVLGAAQTNTAMAAGLSPGNMPVDSTAEAEGTITEAPAIDTTKTASASVNNGDGTFDVSYNYAVRNTGNVVLNDVQMVDHLASVFASAEAFEVLAAPSATLGLCTPSTSFDGVNDIGLLSGTDSMAIGALCVITITLRVTPGADLGPYTNTVAATGTSPGGTPVDDSDEAESTFVENPGIGITKSVLVPPQNNEDGTYTLTYQLLVENTGDVPARQVQVEDSLATTFADATNWVLDQSGVVSGPCTASVTFDGDGDIATLTGGDELAVGDNCSIEMTVTVTPGADLGPYDNVATTTAVSPSGTPLDDEDPATTGFIEGPGIDVDKDVVGPPVANEDGTHTVTFRLRVSNIGNIVLTNVQVDDNLGDTFSDALSIVVELVEVTNGDCTASGDYDGVDQIGTLAGFDRLAVSQSCTIEVTATVRPGDDLGPYTNIAVASGTSPSGEGVTDEDPAETSFEPSSATMTLEKRVVAPGPTPISGTRAAVSYELVVTNTGNIFIQDLQVTDNLSDVFAAAQDWSFESVAVTNGVCTASTTFDGENDNGLLVGSDRLDVGGSCTILLAVEVDGTGADGPFNNTAVANAESATSESLVDNSDAEINLPDVDLIVITPEPPNPSVPAVVVPEPEVQRQPLAYTGANSRMLTLLGLALLGGGLSLAVGARFALRRREDDE